MNWSTTIRNSEGDIALEIDLIQQWDQISQDSIGLRLLASAYLSPEPTNHMTAQVHRCMGLRRRVA
jgi:hypothetical protein